MMNQATKMLATTDPVVLILSLSVIAILYRLLAVRYHYAKKMTKLRDYHSTTSSYDRAFISSELKISEFFYRVLTGPIFTLVGFSILAFYFQIQYQDVAAKFDDKVQKEAAVLSGEAKKYEQKISYLEGRLDASKVRGERVESEAKIREVLLSAESPGYLVDEKVFIAEQVSHYKNGQPIWSRRVRGFIIVAGRGGRIEAFDIQLPITGDLSKPANLDTLFREAQKHAKEDLPFFELSFETQSLPSDGDIFLLDTKARTLTVQWKPMHPHEHPGHALLPLPQRASVTF